MSEMASAVRMKRWTRLQYEHLIDLGAFGQELDAIVERARSRGRDRSEAAVAEVIDEALRSARASRRS